MVLRIITNSTTTIIIDGECDNKALNYAFTRFSVEFFLRKLILKIWDTFNNLKADTILISKNVKITLKLFSP